MTLVSKSVRTSPWLSRAAIARFRSHIVVTDSCTIWLGAIGSDAYASQPDPVTCAWLPRARTCGRPSGGGWRLAHGPAFDVRGQVGAARAIQEAMRDQVSADPAELADLLARVLAAGDPL